MDSASGQRPDFTRQGAGELGQRPADLALDRCHGLAAQFQFQEIYLSQTSTIGQAGLHLRPSLGGVNPQVGYVQLYLFIGFSQIREIQAGFEIQIGVLRGFAALGDANRAVFDAQVGDLNFPQESVDNFF